MAIYTDVCVSALWLLLLLLLQLPTQPRYNEMMFDRVGSLVGAGIKTFLLESSRVVVQQHGEKNYHVFYELLAGMDDDHLDNLSLDREENYKLLHSSGTPPLQEGSPESQRLAKQFEELKHALSLFVGEEEQDHWTNMGRVSATSSALNSKN